MYKQNNLCKNKFVIRIMYCKCQISENEYYTVNKRNSLFAKTTRVYIYVIRER